MAALIRLAELLVVLLGALFVITQVIWPVFTREKMFPVFRQKSERMRREEADKRVHEKLDDLEKRIAQQEKVRERISEIESRISGSTPNTDGDEK